MAFDNVPYALNSVPDIAPGVNGIEINPNARCAGAIEQAYAFFAETGPYADDLGPKKRDQKAVGAGWKPNPTVGGFGVKMAGSTGYFSGAGHELSAWSRECLFVYGASGLQTLSGMIEGGAADRDFYVDANGKIRAFIFSNSGYYATGTTTLVVGQAYHAVVTASAAGGLNVYLNGVLEATTSIPDGGHTGYTNPALRIGYNQFGNTTNTIFYHIEYNSALSAADVMHRYLNQMEMFQAARPRIMVGAAAAPATNDNSTRFIRIPGASMGMTRISGG